MSKQLNFDTQADWLDYRRDKVTASEAAIACGLHPHVSAYELWGRKTGRLPDLETSDEMQAGHDFEPIIAARFMRQTGIAIYDPGAYTMWESADYPFIAATPDRLYQHRRPLECKAVFHNHHEWDDGAPLPHKFQLQTQIHCLNADEGHIAAQMGAKTLAFRYDANPQLFAALVPHIEYFHHCVRLNREPKEAFVLESARKAWRIVHMQDSGATVDLPADEWAGVLESWEVEKEVAAAAQKRADALKFRIEQAVGDATFATIGGRELSYKSQTRAGSLRVRAEMAETLRNLGVEFEETPDSTFRVLRVRKQKGE